MMSSPPWTPSQRKGGSASQSLSRPSFLDSDASALSSMTANPDMSGFRPVLLVEKDRQTKCPHTQRKAAKKQKEGKCFLQLHPPPVLNDPTGD